MKWLNDFPTVGARVFVTLLCVIGTAIALLVFNRFVSDAWLTFLAVMSGVDAATVVGKRLSAKPEVIAAEADASVRKIEATAAAVPPLTPKQAVDAGKIHQGVSEATPSPARPLALSERALVAEVVGQHPSKYDDEST